MEFPSCMHLPRIHCHCRNHPRIHRVGKTRWEIHYCPHLVTEGTQFELRREPWLGQELVQAWVECGCPRTNKLEQNNGTKQNVSWEQQKKQAASEDVFNTLPVPLTSNQYQQHHFQCNQELPRDHRAENKLGHQCSLRHYHNLLGRLPWETEKKDCHCFRPPEVSL